MTRTTRPGHRARIDRDRLAAWLANLVMRGVAGRWQRELAEVTRQQHRRDQLPPQLSEAIEDALVCYVARFRDAPADEWPAVDSTLEGLAWTYRELTGWDAEIEIEEEH